MSLGFQEIDAVIIMTNSTDAQIEINALSIFI